MKAILVSCIIIAAIMLTICFCFAYNPTTQYFINADNATFAWDDNQTEVVGFNLYQKNVATPNVPATKINIPAKVLQYVYKKFPTGSYYFWVTAYDRYGNESDNSTVIQVNKKTIKPKSPTTISVINPNFIIQFMQP